MFWCPPKAKLLTPFFPYTRLCRSSVTGIVRRVDQIVGAKQAEHQIDRRQAGGGDDRACAAFERGQRVAEHVAIGIARAAVIVSPRPLIALEGVGARQIERNRKSTRLNSSH